jgi:hypothetical protein
VASVLPAVSVARTWKVWLPAVSAGEIVSGLVQDVQLPPSMRHSKVEPPSEELNVKLGVVSLDGSEGLESIVVFGAVRSTVQVWLAGVASVLPAASVARTWNVWLPALSAGEMVSGLVQELQLPLSTRHSKLEPPSEELKLKSGVVLLDGSEGLESIVVFGAVRSTVQVWLAGVASVLPAASVARTWNVWLPAVSAGEIVSGLVQAVQLPLSTRHSNVELPSEELKLTSGVVLLDGSAGLESRVVFGAVRSTVQVWLAGVPSVLPAASVARTSKVWLPAVSAGEIDSGLVHDVQLPLSMRHSKLEPPSEELKPKSGVVLLEGSGGLELIVVFGAVRSTVHV